MSRTSASCASRSWAAAGAAKTANRESSAASRRRGITLCNARRTEIKLSADGPDLDVEAAAGRLRQQTLHRRALFLADVQARTADDPERLAGRQVHVRAAGIAEDRVA